MDNNDLIEITVKLISNYQVQGNVTHDSQLLITSVKNIRNNVLENTRAILATGKIVKDTLLN